MCPALGAWDRRLRLLCDRHIGAKLPPGSERLLPIWYPAPPAGTSTITVDMLDRCA